MITTATIATYSSSPSSSHAASPDVPWPARALPPAAPARLYYSPSSASLVNSSPNVANAITGSSTVAIVRKNACDSVFHVLDAHHTNSSPRMRASTATAAMSVARLRVASPPAQRTRPAGRRRLSRSPLRTRPVRRVRNPQPDRLPRPPMPELWRLSEALPAHSLGGEGRARIPLLHVQRATEPGQRIGVANLRAADERS